VRAGRGRHAKHGAAHGDFAAELGTQDGITVVAIVQDQRKELARGRRPQNDPLSLGKPKDVLFAYTSDSFAGSGFEDTMELLNQRFNNASVSPPVLFETLDEVKTFYAVTRRRVPPSSFRQPAQGAPDGRGNMFLTPNKAARQFAAPSPPNSKYDAARFDQDEDDCAADDDFAADAATGFADDAYDNITRLWWPRSDADIFDRDSVTSLEPDDELDEPDVEPGVPGASDRAASAHEHDALWAEHRIERRIDPKRVVVSKYRLCFPDFFHHL